MRRTCSHFRSVPARLAGVCLLALIANAVGLAELTTSQTAPFYTAGSIVQGASQRAGPLAPYSIATLYGTNLSWTTHAVASADPDDRNLPDSLDGVSIYVNGLACGLFYVSPGQVNFLVPYNITSASGQIYLIRQSVKGPTVTVPMAPAAPGFFQWAGNHAVAQHADGTLISPDSPAHPSEIIVLYATGLGRTSPDIYAGSISNQALRILYIAQLEVLLDGVPCDPSSIYYAGITPGFAGLYQINLRLPPWVQPNAAIQVVMGAQSSPPSIELFVD